MSTTPRTDRNRNVSGGPKLSIAEPSIDDMVKWATIHINTPGEYWLALPGEEQGRELARTRRRGKLKSVGGGWLWIEPVDARAIEPVDGSDPMPST